MIFPRSVGFVLTFLGSPFDTQVSMSRATFDLQLGHAGSSGKVCDSVA
jgi:hypothetical protein